MPSIYDYASTATIVTPPDQWVLTGQSDQSPYLAAYHVWLAYNTLADLASCIAHVDGDNLLADTVTPFTNAPSLVGLYLNANTDPGAVGARLQTENNDLKLQVYTTGPTTVQHDWLWQDDGVLQVTSTKQVKGLRAGLDATSEFRYAYGPSTSYPTFRYDFSPGAGGWTAAEPTSALDILSDSLLISTWARGTPGGPFTATARTPLRITGFDTARGTGVTAATMTGLYVVGLCVPVNTAANADSTTVRVRAKSVSGGAWVTIFEVTTTSTTPVDLSDTTPAGGTSAVLAYGLYDYCVEWETANASLLDAGNVARIYVDVQKYAVE